MSLPKPDYDLLLKAINNNIAKLNLQPVSWFIGKIIQVVIEEHFLRCCRLLEPNAHILLCVGVRDDVGTSRFHDRRRPSRRKNLRI